VVVLLRAVSAYNYNRGYYAGMAATADTVKAAEKRTVVKGRHADI
jgi:hypothetical protein